MEDEELLSQEEIDGALADLAALGAGDEEPETETPPADDEVQDETPVAGYDPKAIAREVLGEIQGQIASQQQYQEPEEEQYEPGTTAEEVERNAARYALRHLQTVQNVHAEVEDEFAALEEKFIIPIEYKNEARKILRNAKPEAYRQGVGAELVGFVFTQGVKQGQIVPKTVKTTVKSVGGESKVTAQTVTAPAMSQADRIEKSAFAKAFGGALSEKDINDVFNNRN